VGPPAFDPSRFWIVNENHEVVETDSKTFFGFFADGRNVLFKDRVATFDVFTNFVGDYENLSYSDDGAPLLFVTWVGYQGHPIDWLVEDSFGWSQHCSTWEDASEAHVSMVKAVAAHVTQVGDKPTSVLGQE
jgi:hypothetical protein